MQKFDIVIVGGGIAGMTAALYCARAGKKTVVIEKNIAGGQILTTPEVQNYPGFKSVSGYELTDNIRVQAENFGAQFVYDNAVEVDFSGKEKKITCIDNEYVAGAVILAMGSQSKTLGLKNENELTGQGVSYCATCDGAFFKDKTVMVAGSGRTAVADVNYLSNIASKIYVVDNKPVPEFEFKNVEIISDSVITELVGEPLKSVRISSKSGGRIVNVDGLFVAAGYSPSTFLVRDTVKLNDKGYIITDENMRTNIDGIFAAGDVRQKDLRQLVTAAADGAIAAHFALKFIR